MMYKKELYADPDGRVSAGILAISRTKAKSQFFFSTLTSGYDFRADNDLMTLNLQEQTEIALDNIDRALKQVDSGPSAIVRLTVFVKDTGAETLTTITVIAEAIQRFFSFERPGNMVLPAQSTIFVSRLPYDHLGQIVGIEATAIID